MTPGEGAALLPNVAGVDIAISRDGTRIVYVGQAPGGTQLWLRSLDNLEAAPVRGRLDARDPVFSPGGDAVAFRVGNSLRTSVLGEASSTVLMVAPIDPGPPFRVLPPETLFDIEDSYYLANYSTSYRLSSDDEQFLMARFMGAGARIELVFVQNVFRLLGERAPR